VRLDAPRDRSRGATHDPRLTPDLDGMALVSALLVDDREAFDMILDDVDTRAVAECLARLFPTRSPRTTSTATHPIRSNACAP
jgi:hypothetical protein